MDSNNSGIGVLGVVGVVFVILKLAGVVDWPWEWVTLPFWGPPALVLCLLGIMAIGVALYVPVALLWALVKR